MRLKNLFKSFLQVGLFTACLAFNSAQAFADNEENLALLNSNVFAQLSSSETQLPLLENKEIVFDDVHGISGIVLQSNNKKLKIQSDGVYIISVSAQAGSNGGVGFSGGVQLAIYKNGQPVEFTKRNQWVQNIPSRLPVYPFSSQAILHLHDGDKISVHATADSINLGLLASPESGPSITLSVAKL